MRKKVSNPGSQDERKVKGHTDEWKLKPFTAGHASLEAGYSCPAFKTFLILVAIHASIFLIPFYPMTSFILLLTLIKGWLLAG
ncbi:MAG TPA: hypothetical protein ENN60_03715 [archaeon]|nr:hypothetical protein [archaeon]